MQCAGRDDRMQANQRYWTGSMKADYIKLSTKGVEASGRYVPHAICSFVVLRALSLVVWLTPSVVAAGSALGSAAKVFDAALR